MKNKANFKVGTINIQISVFLLVASAITNIYITQPVLPILQKEFETDLVSVSFTVSAVIFGMAIATLPFGILADRLPIRPLILVGGSIVAISGFLCSLTEQLNLLIALRFIQGLFIPSLTSSLAAYLAKNLPANKLSVIMGSYVAATVVGGLGGRLLGGWIHEPLHWRYALISAAILIVFATCIALLNIPKKEVEFSTKKIEKIQKKISIKEILKRWDLWRSYLTAFGGFAVFSSIFNFLPFHLKSPPFELSVNFITSIYLVYIIGIFMGPLSGRLANKYGFGHMLLAGSLLMAFAILLTLIASIYAIVLSLGILCAGFFAIHAAAVGNLNARLSSGQGRANALYMLFYYIGGWIGISLSGIAFDAAGWAAMIFLCLAMLLIPIVSCIGEFYQKKKIK